VRAAASLSVDVTNDGRQRAVSSNTAASSQNDHRNFNQRSFQDLFQNSSPKFATLNEPRQQEDYSRTQKQVHRVNKSQNSLITSKPKPGLELQEDNERMNSAESLEHMVTPTSSESA